jgi:hypothetical protein
MDTLETKPTPIEVWLSKKNIEVSCMVVHEDETTDTLPVDSLSMRGAQRELTGWFVSEGYKPIGRWETEEIASDEQGNAEGGPLETSRRFKLAPTAPMPAFKAPITVAPPTGFQAPTTSSKQMTPRKLLATPPPTTS